MPRLLENLSPGTRVMDANGADVGEVLAVYGAGQGQLAEFLQIRWSGRNEDVLLPADDVMRIEDSGIVLVHTVGAYDQLAAFDPSANPTLHRL